MSLLVEIRRQPRIVNGELVKVGDACRLPNALALALEKNGLVAWPSEKVSLKAAEVKVEKRAKADKAKAKKRGRPPKDSQ